MTSIHSQAQDCLALLLEYKYNEIETCLSQKSISKSAAVIKLSSVLNSNGEIYDTINNNYKKLPKAIALDALSEAYFTLFNDSKQIVKPFKLFKKSLDVSKEIDNKNLQKLSLLGIINTYNYTIVQSNEEAVLYLHQFKELIENPVDEFHYLINTIIYGLKQYQFKANVDENDVLKLHDVIQQFPKDHLFWHHYYSVVGTYYESLAKLDDATNYYQKSIIKAPVPKFLKRINFRGYIKLAEISKRKKDYNNAIKLIENSSSFINTKDSIRSLYYIKKYTSEYYYLNEDYAKAYEMLKASEQLGDALLYEQNALEVSNLNVKFQAAEKEKQILIEQQKRKQNKNIAFGLSGLLLFAGVTFTLIQKNTKRKQKLAEQQKDLETQKLTTVLKAQELTAIDAMIEGQEKERQRIANDLHDDLGGLMATVKLHFNALKDKQTPELYTKTNALIDEAYNKVRTVAHAKNAGIIANQGLLKAVREMATKISALNKLQIEVIDHGLEHQLENSLELTIFRMIQELITNVIKHANATILNIYITNHDDNLNIMVEDNGIGFKPKQNTKTNTGMGLGSIEKRISHLNGTLTVESEHNSGTTVIIDIPLTSRTAST